LTLQGKIAPDAKDYAQIRRSLAQIRGRQVVFAYKIREQRRRGIQEETQLQMQADKMMAFYLQVLALTLLAKGQSEAEEGDNEGSQDAEKDD